MSAQKIELHTSDLEMNPDGKIIVHPDSSNQDLSSPQQQEDGKRTWRTACNHLVSRDFLRILLLGQVLALCITATTIFSTKLAQGDNPVSIPTTQSFLNYLVLGVVYTGITIYKEGFRGWLHIMRHRSFYCKCPPPNRPSSPLCLNPAEKKK